MMCPGHPDEQVLAAGLDGVHHAAGEVHGGEARHPDVAAGQLLAGQGRRRSRAGLGPDGVALRHGSAAPSAWSTRRRASSGRGKRGVQDAVAVDLLHGELVHGAAA